MKLDTNMMICGASAILLIIAIALMVIKPKNDTDGSKAKRNKKIAYGLLAVGLVGCGAGAYLMYGGKAASSAPGSTTYYYF